MTTKDGVKLGAMIFVVFMGMFLYWVVFGY